MTDTISISMAKKYRTQDGREVRIYAIDAGGERPIHGSSKHGKHWIMGTWPTRLQAVGIRSTYDLVEVKPRHQRTVWLNVYSGSIMPYQSVEGANNSGFLSRLACIKVELDFEEGDGLDTEHKEE